MNFHLKSKAIASANLPKSPEFKILPVFFKSKARIFGVNARVAENQVMIFHLKSKAIAFENLPKFPEFKILHVFFKSKARIFGVNAKVAKN